MDLKFSWAPSGNAIYFGRAFRGARNLWKMTMDPDTLRATALQRLTTGSGPDTQLAVSADGKRLAFTEETQRIRAWFFPFDATQGRVNGPGQAVTSPGVEAWHVSLSADGKKLAFCGIRGGRTTVWEKSLADGREAPIIDDEYRRDNPQWSPDGMRLAYSRWKQPTDDAQILVWSSQSHSEEPLSASSAPVNIPCDWSSDGELTHGSLSLPGHTGVGGVWRMITRVPPGTWETLPLPSSKAAGDTAYQLQIDPRLRVRGRGGRTTDATMVSPSEGNEARRNGRQGVAASHSTVEPGEPSRRDPGEGSGRLL